MRWVIIGLLAYISYGSIGLCLEDWRRYRQINLELAHSAVIAGICAAGIACLVFRWM